MIKKLFLIVVTFFATMHAEDMNQDDYDFAYQELIYDVGISLTHQDLIVDMPTAKSALLHTYQDVAQFMEIVDLYMIIDEELVDQQITTFDDLIEYEINGQEILTQAGVAWLSAYQKLFIIFASLHSDDISFATWYDDMAFFASLEDDQKPEDPDYLAMWQANCAVLQAQEDFEQVLKDLE